MIDNLLANQHLPPQYSYSFFVNRQDELDLLEDRVNKIRLSDVTEPIINFWGVSGVGKTWLLHHLQYLYRYQQENDLSFPLQWTTFTLRYSFAEHAPAVSFAHLTQQLTAEALSQLASALDDNERQNLYQVSDASDIDSLIRTLRVLSRRLIPLILLDDTEQVETYEWESVERKFIEPLVTTDRILFVVAGRRRVPRWRRFEVRRRVMDPDQSLVKPFGKGSARSQIRSGGYHFPLKVEDFFHYTAGSPYLVDAVAKNISGWQQEEDIHSEQALLDRHRGDLLGLLQRTEDGLLKSVPAKLRRVLDILSPLRFYRLEALRFMLTENDNGKEQLPDNYYLSLLRELEQETEVVWWDHSQRAYVTSEVVRRLINRRQWLERDSNSNYTDRHQRALQMYLQLVKRYPTACEDFILETWFHSASLYLADQDLSRLQSQVKGMLEFAGEHLQPLDRLLILYLRVKRDYELLDLLPGDLNEKLLQDIEQILEEEGVVTTPSRQV